MLQRSCECWLENLVRSALRFGYKERLFAEMPNIAMPRKLEYPDHYLTRAEAKRLIAVTRHPHLTLFIGLALAATARAGALPDLTWDRITSGLLRGDSGSPSGGEEEGSQSLCA
jgi:hypothetical protein